MTKRADQLLELQMKLLGQDGQDFLDEYRGLFNRTERMADILTMNAMRSLGSMEHEDLGLDRSGYERVFHKAVKEVLETIFDIIPPEEAMIISNNLEHHLDVVEINGKYGVDLVTSFENEFFTAHGKEFHDDEEFALRAVEFEEKWANSPKEYLDGLSPNEALNRLRK